MPFAITRADFVGPTSYGASAEAAKLANFDLSIATYGDEYLRAVMGDGCLAAFKASMASNIPEQRWIDLRDGVTYQINAMRPRFAGILPKVPGTTTSTGEGGVQAYILHQHLKNTAESANASGVGRALVENGTSISPGAKMQTLSRMFSEASRMLQNILLHRETNGVSVYPEFDQATVYTAADFIRSKMTNAFGI